MKKSVFKLCGVALIGLCFSFIASPSWAANSQPNVVLFTLDTMRADHLQCYGYKAIETPNLDSLASQGVRFAHAYSAVPITLPSHTVILTGTYPMRNGMHDFSGNRLNSTLPTLASILHGRGYETGASLGSAVLDSRFGLNRGFDFYYDHFDFSRLDERNIDEMARPGNEVVDHALGWLESHHQKPFLLWVHLYDAHAPYHPPEPFLSRYRGRPYDGEIAFVDEQVGRVINYLKLKDLYANTMIVVAADHGESLGEHGEKTHGFFIYDATLHVPLIFKLPGSAQPSTHVVENAVNLADILPTVLEGLGIAIPGDVQGKSLIPEMHGQQPKSPAEMYAETYLPRIHFNWSELRSIRFRQYYFIDAPRPELYDTSTDPHELKNIYSEQRAVANELRKRLAALISRYTPKSGQTAAVRTGLDPELEERLKSLGYMAVGSASDEVISDRSLPDPKDRIQVYDLVSEALSDSQHEHFVESVSKLEQAEKTEKNSIPIEYLLGLDYLRMHNYTASVEKLQNVVRLSPTYSLATYYLGLAYADGGDYRQAILTFQRALELDGSNYDAAFNLGAAYLKVDRIADAEESLRESVKINPSYSAGYEALGEVLLYEKKTDEAIAAFRDALRTGPQNKKALENLVRALQSKGLDSEAEEEMRKYGGTDLPH
jgi:arylsulfatase A-like enzyme/Flp pilus assembly protein TadD